MITIESQTRGYQVEKVSDATKVGITVEESIKQETEVTIERDTQYYRLHEQGNHLTQGHQSSSGLQDKKPTDGEINQKLTKDYNPDKFKCNVASTLAFLIVVGICGYPTYLGYVRYYR